MGETLGSITLSNDYEELNTLPSHLAWSEESEKKSYGDRPCWNGFYGHAPMVPHLGRKVWIGSEDPRMFK